MKSVWSVLLPLVLLCASPIQAQDTSEGCKVSSLDLDSSSTQTEQPAPTASPPVTDATPATSVTPTTDAEEYVQDVIASDGVHVVHFWAPWCSNSTRELDNGWAEVVTQNPSVTFTFVTVWNNGATGTDRLAEYNLPDRVSVVAQPDLGPSEDESKRRRSFLSHPVTWIPSTWIFHENGELAFAMNYGEMEMSTVQDLIDATQKEW